MKAPIANKSTANQRKEHNVEKCIQWVTKPSPTIRVCLHSFTSCDLPILRNPTKFSENSKLYQFKVIQCHRLGVNQKRICDFLLVINSNFGRTVFEILTHTARE